MSKSTWRAGLAAGLLAGAAGTALAAPIVYTGTHTIGAYTASLSVTTDGTLGAIGRAQITAFDLVLSKGADTAHLYDLGNGTSNATLYLSNLPFDLQATATNLVLPYDAGPSNYELCIIAPGNANFFAAGHGRAASVPMRS